MQRRERRAERVRRRALEPAVHPGRDAAEHGAALVGARAAARRARAGARPRAGSRSSRRRPRTRPARRRSRRGPRPRARRTSARSGRQSWPAHRAVEADASRGRGRRPRCPDSRRSGARLPVRPRMKASRRGSGSSVRNVPPPIATIWPFTSGQDRLTSGAGHGCRTIHREGAYSDVTPRPRLGGARSARARRRRTGRRRRQGGEAEAHDRRCARSTRCRRRRRRTSAASAARASRRPRSARAASSRPTKNRVRTVTTYCDGGTRTVVHDQARIDDDQDGHAGHRCTGHRPRPSRRARARAAPAKRAFRLTLLHNNDGESKYGVGDSIANYGGVTRFKTVLDRLRAEADATERRAARRQRGQGHGHDQLRRQLPRRPEPARLLPALRRRRRARSTTRSRSRRIGYDAVTIGNHEYDFGPTRLAQLIAAPRAAACRS